MKKYKVLTSIFMAITILVAIFSVNKTFAEENPFEWYAYAEGTGSEDSKTYYVSKDGGEKTQAYFIYDGKKTTPYATDFLQAKRLRDFFQYKKEKANKELLKTYLLENIRPGIDYIYQRLLKVLFYLKNSKNTVKSETANKFIQKVTGAYVYLDEQEKNEYKEVISKNIPSKFSIQLFIPKNDHVKALITGVEDESANEELIEKSISKNLNLITMKGVEEGQEIYLTRKKDNQKLNTPLLLKESKVVLKDKNNIEANNENLGINFEYKNKEKTLIAKIDENIDYKEVFLGFVDQSLVDEDTALENDGISVNIPNMKKEIEEKRNIGKTAFKKLLENLENKKQVEERLNGLIEGLKGNLLQIYKEGVLVSKLTVEGQETKNETPLVVLLDKDEDKKTIINTVSYKNLLPYQKYILKGQISIINEEGRNIKIIKEITKEFITPKNGEGEETLIFKDITLNPGQKYFIDVNATSVKKYEFKDGIKHHIADHENLSDVSKTFEVKKQEIKQPQDQKDDPNIQNDQAPDSTKNQSEGSNKTEGTNKLEIEKNKEEGKKQDLENKKDENPNSKKDNSNIAKPSNTNQNKNNLPSTKNEKPKSNKGSTTKIVVAVISSLVGVSAITAGSFYIYKKRNK